MLVIRRRDGEEVVIVDRQGHRLRVIVEVRGSDRVVLLFDDSAHNFKVVRPEADACPS